MPSRMVSRMSCWRGAGKAVKLPATRSRRAPSTTVQVLSPSGMMTLHSSSRLGESGGAAVNPSTSTCCCNCRALFRRTICPHSSANTTGNIESDTRISSSGRISLVSVATAAMASGVGWDASSCSRRDLLASPSSLLPRVSTWMRLESRSCGTAILLLPPPPTPMVADRNGLLLPLVSPSVPPLLPHPHPSGLSISWMRTGGDPSGSNSTSYLYGTVIKLPSASMLPKLP
mmetsp:Transcript_18655/g.30974  ORF Transcript_18655/g.30974 Transcript_18655/m.30974 type:complete len:230 (+) Transcript_18655:628-1317(+)